VEEERWTHRRGAEHAEIGELRRDVAGRGGEFAGEIGGAKAALRGVGVGVAEAVALGMSEEGAAAFIGEAKLATVFGRFGAFRSHARRISFCKYTCLVTGGYV